MAEHRILNLNKIMVVGRLTRDPEMKYVPSGSPVVNIGIAINKRYKKDDEWQEQTSFINFVAWNKLAEICSEYLHKGSLVYVEGEIQSRSWETDDGAKRTVIEIKANNITFLDKKETEEG